MTLYRNASMLAHSFVLPEGESNRKLLWLNGGADSHRVLVNLFQSAQSQ